MISKKNKYLSNIVWLVFDIFIKIFLSFGMTILIARYMGVEIFGLYSYLLSIFSIFILISALGMNGIVVKDLVENNDKEIVLGSALFLQRLGGFLCSCILVFWALFSSNNYKNDEFLYIFILILPVLILQSSNIFKYWFEYSVESKFTVISQNISLLLGAVAKILIIFFEFHYLFILLFTIFEQIIMIFLLKRFFNKKSNLNAKKIKMNVKVCRSLLSRSWPLIFSGLFFILYMRIDQIMIGELLGMEEVGIFSVVVRLIEISYFIPTILISTFFSKLVYLKKENNNDYNNKMQILYDVTVCVAVVFCGFMIFFSNFIINNTFGKEYILASDQIKIYAFVCIFYFLSVISGRWYINEGLQKLAMIRNLLGLCISIILNFILIPKYGIKGATMSTVVAFIFSSYLFDYFDKRTRVVFYQKSRSLWLVGAVSRIFQEYFKKWSINQKF